MCPYILKTVFHRIIDMVAPQVFVDDGNSFPAVRFMHERGVAIGARIRDALMKVKEMERPVLSTYFPILGDARLASAKWELAKRQVAQRDYFGTGRIYVRTTTVEYALCAIRSIAETGCMGISLLENGPSYHSGTTASLEPVTHGKKSLLAALERPNLNREDHAAMRDMLAAYGAEVQIRETVLAVPCGEGVYSVSGKRGEYVVKGAVPIGSIIMVANNPDLLREIVQAEANADLLREIVRAEAHAEKLKLGEEASIEDIEREIMGRVKEMCSSAEKPGERW